jgi:hypothetical protein
MTDYEESDKAWAAAEEYAPGDIEAQDDFVTGWLTYHREVGPELIRLRAQVKSFGVVNPGGFAGPGEAPDDSESDKMIAEAESFNEAVWEIAEKYGVPITNNYPRWQNGQFLRASGEFLAEIKKAAERFKVGAASEVEK